MIHPDVINVGYPVTNSEPVEIVVDINSLDDLIIPSPAEVISAYVGFIRAYHLWMHGAHNVAKGPAFAGDHVTLYGHIYTEVQDQIDKVIEKGVGVYQEESIACPMQIIENAAIAMEQWESPANQHAERIAELALIYTKLLVKCGEGTVQMLGELDALSLGMENMLADLTDLHEGYVYLLQQRNKD